MAMTTRRGKGAELTWDEMDDNIESIEPIQEGISGIESTNISVFSPGGSIQTPGLNNMLINSPGTTLGGINSTINNVTVIGINSAQLDFLLLSDAFVVPRLLVYEIPVFESDAAAGVGGLIAGMAYRNAAGQAFYKLP